MNKKYNKERPFTIKVLEDYINSKKMEFTINEFLDYWDKKKWLTQKGTIVKTYESAINVYNSIYLTKKRKKNGEPTDNLKAKRVRDAKENVHYIKYKTQLLSPQWLAFRKFILVARGNSCEKCGSKKSLQVHHLQYIDGKYAWEYNCNEVIVLCGSCHKKIHNI